MADFAEFLEIKMSSIPKIAVAAAVLTAALFVVPVHAQDDGSDDAVPTDGATSLPEPGTWALVGLALAIGAGVSRRRRK